MVKSARAHPGSPRLAGQTRHAELSSGRRARRQHRADQPEQRQEDAEDAQDHVSLPEAGDAAEEQQGQVDHRGREGQDVLQTTHASLAWASLAAALMSSASTSLTADSTIAVAFSRALRILTSPGSETSARMPECPGAMAFSICSARSERCLRCRILPAAAPAAPRAAALPRIEGGKTTPSTTPPTTPHLRPDFVLWSVAFWISSLPSAPRCTTITPSISRRSSSIAFSAS